MSGRSSKPAPTPRSVTLVDGTLQINIERLKRPATTFMADWVDLRSAGGSFELLLGSTSPFQDTFSSFLVCNITHESWTGSLLHPAGAVVKSLVSAGIEAAAPRFAAPVDTVAERRSIDWVALATGNGVAELICYRISQHSVHLLMANPHHSSYENIIFPEITVLMPVDRALYVLRRARDLMTPQWKFFPEE
jgi:hypothetical protein